MPANVVKTPEQERLWNKAKTRAEAEGQSGNYAYIMGVFKRMGGMNKSFHIVESLEKGYTVTPIGGTTPGGKTVKMVNGKRVYVDPEGKKPAVQAPKEKPKTKKEEDEEYVRRTHFRGQGPIPGLEGPFKYKTGKILYYDPKENGGTYYDREADRYLTHEEAWEAMGKSLEKSTVPGIFRLNRVPGQVPSRENLEAMRLAEKPPENFSVARLLKNDNPRFSAGAVIDGLGFDAAESNDWHTFLQKAVDTSPNEVVFRQGVMSKCLERKYDPALRRAILQRSLSYWKNVQKSMTLTEIVTVDDLLQKAESRGGKYYKRVPVVKGGKTTHRYFYNEDDYKKRKDAHTGGEENERSYLSGSVMKCVQKAGEAGCHPKDMEGLVTKFGAKKVAEVLRESAKGGKLSFKKGRFYLPKKETG